MILWLALILSFPLQAHDYPWLEKIIPKNHLSQRVPPPEGFTRVFLPQESFGNWLRNLPLKEGKPWVRLYNGFPKLNQLAHVAVFDIDVGKKDLQQCADAVIRLRAEYLYSQKKFSDISFRFTSGHAALYSQWSEGARPKVQGSKVEWLRGVASKDLTYSNFRQYLETVFLYAGSFSLDRDLKSVPVEEVAPGDTFVQGGFPGHAVIVLDVAKKAGKTVFLLAQSYMPAQEIHLLKNPNSSSLSPWYEIQGEKLVTPEWTFNWGTLKRF